MFIPLAWRAPGAWRTSRRHPGIPVTHVADSGSYGAPDALRCAHAYSLYLVATACRAPEPTWLVEEREVNAVGIDTASIDRGQSTMFEAHRVLATADVPIFENLTRLEALPARGAVVVALPMKLAGGRGGPLRAIAIVP